MTSQRFQPRSDHRFRLIQRDREGLLRKPEGVHQAGDLWRSDLEGLHALDLREDDTGRTGHHDLTLVENHDLVGKLGDWLALVFRHDDGHAVGGVQLLCQREERERPLRVKGRGRFVEHNDLRLHREHRCGDDPLNLPARQVCRPPVEVFEIVKKAAEIKNFVRIDMEDSPYTDKTINVYKRIYQDYKNVGVVIQSYMRRSYDDVITLNKIGTNYRLCKGIYVESASIAYKDKQEVRNNYLKLLDAMFKDGNYVGIATHDKYLIDEAYKRIKEKNISKDKFEFQMLLGVREDLRDKINNDGYKIRIYVPFGKDWYAYSVRRLKENPSVAGHIAKSFLTFGKR